MANDYPKLRKFQKGRRLVDEMSADNLNPIIDAVNQIRRDMQLAAASANTGSIQRPQLAIIRANGPRGVADDPDTTDNTYWVKLAFPDTSFSGAGPMVATSGSLPDTTIVKATNMAEAETGSHYLDADTPVQLFRMVVGWGTPVGHWFFWRDPAERFFARITAATQDGTNKRWKYTAVEVTKTAALFTGWTDKATGRTATGATNGIWLLNLNEYQNGATGTYGNGVSSTNLTGTFAVKPIPTDTIVAVDVVRFPVDGVQKTEWHCEIPNGIDGAC